MRVHLIKKETIEDYGRHNAQSKTPLSIWLTAVRFADWNNTEDIKEAFAAADILGEGINRVIFNIGGNNYRIICKYAFGEKQVHLFILWIGTHAEYDKLCNKGEQYTINMF